MSGKRVNQALTLNLRLSSPSILAAALILATCTSGRCVRDGDSQSLPLIAWQRGHTKLIGLVGRTGTNGFAFGMDEDYHPERPVNMGSQRMGHHPATIRFHGGASNQDQGLAGSDSFWLDRVEFNFRKQSADFANEQPPMLRVFRRLERQEGFFKLSQ